MFVDYIALMLINMTAGFFILAHFVYAGLDAADRSRWVPGFTAVGAVAFVTGTHMALTWPIPKLPTVNLSFANVAFGEMTVLFGILFLCAALACAKNWRLDVLGIYAFFAGLAAVVVGAQIVNSHLTQSPNLTGAGFFLSGLAGMLFLPVIWCLPGKKAARCALAVLMAVAGLIWAFVSCTAFWGHIARFSQSQ